jgi:hypothetical protein
VSSHCPLHIAKKQILKQVETSQTYSLLLKVFATLHGQASI